MVVIQRANHAEIEGKQVKVLILGGCGFIGKNLAEILVEDGIPSVVFDKNADPQQSSPSYLFIQGEFSDRAKLETIIESQSITHVIHLVSTTLPKSSNEDKPYDLSSNVIQTLHLLDLCVKYQIKKILFMSSGGTIYGVPNTVPVDESHPNDPICSYGISKLAIEKYLFLYRQLYGLNYIALRAANPYGPGQNPHSGQGVIANFAHKILSQQPIEVWGDGSIVRDYFHVHDLAKLTKLALLSSETGVFNAGSGVGVSLNQLIRTLGAVVNCPTDIVYKEQRGLDVPAIVLNCAAAQSKFGWQTEISLRTGIEDYVSWYRATYQKDGTRK
jgi:UDP-glucose 4-epimerase